MAYLGVGGSVGNVDANGVQGEMTALVWLAVRLARSYISG